MNRVSSVLKEACKYNKQHITSNLENNDNNSLDISDNKIFVEAFDLISYLYSEKIPENFKELEEENFEKRGIKRKYEDEYQDENDNIVIEKEVCISGKVIFELEYE